MVFEFGCDSAFAFSVHQRKPPDEVHLGEWLQGGFLPPTGRIPPDSGGWHRGVFSRSVAGAQTKTPSLDTLSDYDMKQDFSNGTRVPIVLRVKEGSHIAMLWMLPASLSRVEQAAMSECRDPVGAERQ
jgi:hypothetical protein